MKYNIGDKVIFIKKSSKEDSWKLNNYEVYEISDKAINDSINNGDYTLYANYYGVKHKNGSETTWYDEKDFIGLKEYRKLKLERINAIG